MLASVMLVAAIAPASHAQSIAGQAPARPTVESARVGIATPGAAEAPTAMGAQLQAPARESAALMIVGGAALLAGLVIGGGAGTALALGGALLGLYGLWMYVR
jgi:hypothetical protein